MLEFALDKKHHRRKGVAPLLVISAGFHGFGLAALLLIDQTSVAVMREPTTVLTFFELAAFALPPDPPPPPPRQTEQATEKVRVEKPDPDVAPKEIPSDQPQQKPEAGPAGGEKNGIEGGIEGSLTTTDSPPPYTKPEPPQEQPKPPAEVRLGEATVRKKRLRGNEAKYPTIAESRGLEATLTVTIKIGVDGHVKEILFHESHPLFERSVREAIETWVFEPHRVDGRAVPMVSTYRFAFRLR